MGVSHDIAAMLTCDVNYSLLLSYNFCIFRFKIIVLPIYTNGCFSWHLYFSFQQSQLVIPLLVVVVFIWEE